MTRNFPNKEIAEKENRRPLRNSPTSRRQFLSTTGRGLGAVDIDRLTRARRQRRHNGGTSERIRTFGRLSSGSM